MFKTLHFILFKTNHLNHCIFVVDHDLSTTKSKSVISDSLNTFNIVTTYTKQSIVKVLKIVETYGSLIQILEVKLFRKFIKAINPVIFGTFLLTFTQIFLKNV